MSALWTACGTGSPTTDGGVESDVPLTPTDVIDESITARCPGPEGTPNSITSVRPQDGGLTTYTFDNATTSQPFTCEERLASHFMAYWCNAGAPGESRTVALDFAIRSVIMDLPEGTVLEVGPDISSMGYEIYDDGVRVLNQTGGPFASIVTLTLGPRGNPRTATLHGRMCDFGPAGTFYNQLQLILNRP
jgi:hypothetical protein